MTSFLKKEIDHYFLTNKWFIFLIIFIALGILNPFTAKITPALLENMLGAEFSGLLGEPSAIDSWVQFFNNVPQLGLVAFLLLMANSMSKELQEGTLSIFLAKGLKRKSVILSKLLFHTITWTIGYSVTIIVTYLYTIYYWDQSIVQQLPFTLFGVYAFALSFIFITFLGNTMTDSTMGGLAFSGGYFVVLMLLKTFTLSTWNPFNLLSELEERLTSNIEFSYGSPLVAVAIILIVCTAGSIIHFNKKAL